MVLLSKQYCHITYPAQTVVIDKKNKHIVSCPTKDEAVEYIKEIERETTDED